MGLQEVVVKGNYKLSSSFFKSATKLNWTKVIIHHNADFCYEIDIHDNAIHIGT